MQKEKPLLFSTLMVEAILAGRKKMTRRMKTNLKPGDIIWVRETWAETSEEYGGPIIGFKASGAFYIGPKNELLAPCNTKWDLDNYPSCGKWRPSIFMPKKAARIWLKCTGVREEPLRNINEEDALAEGVEINPDGSYHDYLFPKRLWQDDAKASFQSLWLLINGRASWDANPVVSVISFDVLSTTGRPDNKEIAASNPEVERSVATDSE